MENSSRSKYFMEQQAAQIFGLTLCEKSNQKGIDGFMADGSTVQIKNLEKNKASLSNKMVDGSLLENIEHFAVADHFIINLETSIKFIILTKEEFVEWATSRVVIDRKSSKRGGGLKMRIGKNERTPRATEKIKSLGLA